MSIHSSKRGFSLIELLVALSILSVVAAIIVPRFLNVRSQAQDTVAAAQLAEINNATNAWLSLGGKRSVLTGQTNNPYEYYYYLLFLSTQSDGTDAYRKLSTNTGGSIIPNLLPTDSLGSGGSWTVCLPDIKLGGMTGTTPDRPNASSLPDGFYGKAPSPTNIQGGYTTSTNANGLYVKQGSQVTELESQAAALFIYTGQLLELNN